MIADELEKLTWERIDDYYRHRLHKLETLNLSYLLADMNPYLLCIEATLNVPLFIERMLRNHMYAFEQAIFSELFVELCEHFEGDPDFYLKPIRSMRDYPASQRTIYEKEWDKAVNRFEREFLNDFANSDGSIDWEKLVRFNSGKGKIGD